MQRAPFAKGHTLDIGTMCDEFLNNSGCGFLLEKQGPLQLQWNPFQQQCTMELQCYYSLLQCLHHEQ